MEGNRDKRSRLVEFNSNSLINSNWYNRTHSTYSLLRLLPSAFIFVFDRSSAVNNIPSMQPTQPSKSIRTFLPLGTPSA